MQQRKGTAEQWTNVNPILAEGELGWESDTNSFKIGDGVNNWATLAYFVDEDGVAGSLGDYVELALLGVSDGVATLDGSGTLTITELPSSVATTTYVDTAISNLVDTAPDALNTLNELAAALNDDASFATTVTNSLATKQDIVSGVSDTEIGYLDGVTSGIQGQIDGKANTSHTHVIGDVTDLQTTLDAKAPLTPSVNAKTANYTLTAGDKGEVITVTGTRTVTVPGNVFAAGDRVDVVNIGTGVVTFAGSGLTINSKDGALTIDSQYAGATILFGSATVAYLIGAIA